MRTRSVRLFPSPFGPTLFLTVLLASSTAPPVVAAEPNATFDEILAELQPRMRDLFSLLEAHRRDAGRRLAILDALTGAAHTVATTSPRAGVDSAGDEVERARSIAEEDPPFEGVVPAALDRFELALRRDEPGERREAKAARLLAELVPLEDEMARVLASYVGESEKARILVEGIPQVASHDARQAIDAFRKLLEAHRRALEIRDR